MKLIKCITFSFILTFSNQALSYIYQWTDKSGVVHYTDNPPKETKSSDVKENVDSNSVIRNGIKKYQASQAQVEHRKKTTINEVDRKMGVTSIAKCAAAALKINSSLWSDWYNKLYKRYSLIYGDRLTSKELSKYTLERVLDKRSYLNSLGFDSKSAFKKYFNMNCRADE